MRLLRWQQGSIVATATAATTLGTLSVLPGGAVTAAHAQTGGGQAVAKVNMVKGFVTLYVNGRRVGRVGQTSPLEATGAGIGTLPISR